ncbi:hypothetical protein ACSBR1_025213 [Camellia fascicularis]
MECGCKCFYLGIDDGRQDVGTTVIVRDLFYNQPVRRKHIQSSPKKVLHSVKKCVLRIAIVHPKVFFEVVDIESEDELFCTTPSSSPLSLLTSGFGIEISSSLHELNVSDGVLKLSGYMSSPRDTSFVKACQFVCIHEVEYLVSVQRFNSSDLQEANMKLQNGKRSRSQTYETYILNLSCPRSWYDITFEPSKTSVEFKQSHDNTDFTWKAQEGKTMATTPNKNPPNDDRIQDTVEKTYNRIPRHYEATALISILERIQLPNQPCVQNTTMQRYVRILTVKKQWLGYRKPSYRGVYIETQLPKPIYKGFVKTGVAIDHN